MIYQRMKDQSLLLDKQMSDERDIFCKYKGITYDAKGMQSVYKRYAKVGYILI